MTHTEQHRSDRIGWLRAAVLGANDGILSTSSLILGVAAAGASKPAIVIAGLAGLVAGAMSMAAGEYVSVSSQADTETADLEREREELAAAPAAEQAELAAIYVSRGLEPELAEQVAVQLMAHDALGAHSRDELGITEVQRARPLLAAAASAGSFSLGAALALAVVLLVPLVHVTLTVVVSTLVGLAILGWLAAWTGGSPVVKGMVRVTAWGAVAMALTYAIGALFGTVV
ncbi:MAG: VIT family protein [Truepera sp.]|jgi:VIT1/CCC1 family predicted Fe2+/Mn2+ transporter|nr:VIT family protein [Truepera sp.]